jgi:prepilin-type processing-associated H-X9-DG protein
VLATDAKPRVQSPMKNFPDGWITWTPTLDPRKSVTLGDVLRDVSARDYRSFDRARHKGRINVVFADGHVNAYQINERDLDNVYLLAR